MFGMPFHSITCHFGEWFRLIALSSLNAENQERVFKDIKNTEGTTNFQPEHLSTNCLIRTQVKTDEGKMGKCYAKQENHIHKESAQLPASPASLITPDMIAEDVAAFAAHRHRISDYLLEGCWNNTNENGVWRFNDGEADDTPNSDLKPMHFR